MQHLSLEAWVWALEHWCHDGPKSIVESQKTIIESFTRSSRTQQTRNWRSDGKQNQKMQNQQVGKLTADRSAKAAVPKLLYDRANVGRKISRCGWTDSRLHEHDHPMRTRTSVEQHHRDRHAAKFSCFLGGNLSSSKNSTKWSPWTPKMLSQLTRELGHRNIVEVMKTA